jgi:hypothetical protein
VVFALAVILALVLVACDRKDAAVQAPGKSNFTWVVSKRLTVENATLLQDDVTVTNGDLKVGDGTPGVTQDGEDAYIEGTLEVDGAAQFDGAVAMAGSVSDGGGTFTIADDVIIDGAADAIQLKVQGYTTQTNNLVVFEQSDGTDVFVVDNDGDVIVMGDFDEAVFVDGEADAVQLTVSGYTTQTNSLLVLEQSDGTDVATVSNAGAVDFASTVNYGTDNLYPLGYASSAQQMVCGTSGVFTETSAVAVSGITTITYALVTQITDPASTGAFLTVDAPTTSTLTINSWETDATTGTTGVNAYYCVVGDQ